MDYEAISIKTYPSSYSGIWTTIFDAGRAAWNNSTTDVSISVSSSSPNSLEAAQCADTCYGLCTQTHTSAGYTTSFIIQINTTTITNAITTSFRHV